jgi:hypothetical protein
MYLAPRIGGLGLNEIGELFGLKGYGGIWCNPHGKTGFGTRRGVKGNSK